MERWDEIATAQKPLMEQHTPHTYLELLGQAEGAEIEPHALFLLATEYEISMESFGDRGKPMSVGDKCTGLLTHKALGSAKVREFIILNTKSIVLNTKSIIFKLIHHF